MEWQLWSTLTIFWVVRLMKFPSNPLPGLLSSALSITSSLWIFCIVFYISECFARFTKHQKSACESSEHVFDCCILARKHLSKEGSLSFVRLLNAAHLLAYVGLGGEYNEQNFLVPFLKKYFLLTEQEFVRIKETGLDSGHSFREVIVWLFQIVKDECGSLSKTQQKLISGKLLSFGDSLSNFYAFKELPIPFSYVHCINLNVFLFLLMYSFALAYSYSKFDKTGESLHFQTVLGDSLIESFYLFVYTLVMLSLKTLGRRFAEPLGHDSEDLNVFHFVEATIAGTTSIMREFSRPKIFSPEPEESFGIIFQLSKLQTKQKKIQKETQSTKTLNAQMIMLCEDEYSEEKESLSTVTPIEEYSEKNESLMTRTPEKEDSKRSASFAPVHVRNTWFTRSSQIYPEEQLKV